jgi:hypothetical protein
MAQSSGQKAAVSPAVQRLSPHKLQSVGQERVLSLKSQTPLPQLPQSKGQLSLRSQTPSQLQSMGQVPNSPWLHTPSPQMVLAQSSGQDAAFSEAWQLPLPQLMQSKSQRSLTSHSPLQPKGWQSSGQEVWVSPGPQTPSPQVAVVEQSIAQLPAVSSRPQSPSPQLSRQSTAQPWRVSFVLQTASPQKQSDGQDSPFSPGSHRALPHWAISIGCSPSGARPQAPISAPLATSSDAHRARLQRSHDVDPAQRIGFMYLTIETCSPARRKRPPPKSGRFRPKELFSRPVASRFETRLPPLGPLG